MAHEAYMGSWVEKTLTGEQDRGLVQLLSHVLLFATLRTVAHQASLSFTISQSLLNFMSIESVMLLVPTGCKYFTKCLVYTTSFNSHSILSGEYYYLNFLDKGDREALRS